jgi:hypothetical protein
MVKTNELCLKCTKETTYFGKYFCGEECEEWVNENGMIFNIHPFIAIRSIIRNQKLYKS